MKITLIALLLLLSACSSTNTTRYKAPEWAEGIVWYQIFPERFRNGDLDNDPTRERARGPENWKISSWTADWYAQDEWESKEDFYDTVFERRYGGDLQGVIDKLDYLKELGVGGIYFNPVFDAQSLHKYDASYYHHIDRNFGPDPKQDVKLFKTEDPSNPETWQWSSADSLFLNLIEKAHARNIKVVIDGVWNHTGTEFWAFRDLIKNQKNSVFKNWYVVKSFDVPSTPDTNEFDYEGWWGFKGLPVLREEDGNLIEPVKNHILAVTRRWMDPNGDGDPSDGIDGWRLDVAEEVGMNFWKDWHSVVKQINPEAITVAEIWTDKAKEFINADMFTSVMNYRFAYAVKEFLIDKSMNADEFRLQLNQIKSDYPEGSVHVLQNLMDSHDTPRLASIIVNPGLEYDRNGKPRDGFKVRKPNDAERKIQKLVALFQFTWPGAPMIYYGTEAGMWGADDPDDRKPMLWSDMEYEDERMHPYGKRRPIDSNSFDQELFDYYSSLIQLRNTNAVLKTGERSFLNITNNSQIVAFKRFINDKNVYVIINSSDTSQTLEFKVGNEHKLTNLLTGQEYLMQDDSFKIQIDPNSGLILK